MHERQRSHLDLTDEFVALSRCSAPVTIDGRCGSDDLPARHISLEDLRAIMLKRRTSDQLKDAVWSHLVRMSHIQPDPWKIAAAGMLLPGLKRIADRLHSVGSHPANRRRTSGCTWQRAAARVGRLPEHRVTLDVSAGQ